MKIDVSNLTMKEIRILGASIGGDYYIESIGNKVFLIKKGGGRRNG